MRREIKFRAWSPEITRMLQNPLHRCDAGSLLDGEDFYKNWVLMQYTGHKDKNGREIYEGDILESKLNVKQRYEVRWINDGSGFYVYEDSGTSEEIRYATEAFDLFIIGNIYENPELLTN